MSDHETTEAPAKPVDVFVDNEKVEFATDDVTGAQIKEKAGVPADYSLYRRAEGSNEPIADTEQVELKRGDHFFSRPPSNIS